MILVSLFPFLPALLWILALLQFDDPLAPEARALVALTTAPEANNAYLYLLGIDAPLDQDPARLGQTILERVRQQEQLIAGDLVEADQYGLPEYESLPRPQGELFCRWAEETCPSLVLSSRQTLPALSEAHLALQQRYQTFMAMDDFQTLAKPSIKEPIPQFQYLMSGHRLVMLHALLEAEQGEPATAIHQLVDTLAKVRTQLAQSDSLIGKMVYLTLMSENLDVLSSVLARHGYDLAPNLAPMSAAERDFSSPMAREFAMGYYMFQSLDRHPRFFDTASGARTTPSWVVRMMFKPNMTINATLPHYLQAVELSLLEPEQYAERAMDSSPTEIPEPWLRNPVGTILNRVEGIRYETYVSEAFNIHGKLSLLNQIVNMEGVPEKLGSLDNPLSKTDNAVYWSNSGQQLCLDGPGEDTRRFRCLVVRDTQYGQ